MTEPAKTAEDLRAEQVDEWNTYAATVPIDWYGQRAYNVGDRVPASAVDGDQAWIPREWVGPLDEARPASSPEPPTIDAAAAAAPPVSSPEGGVVDLTPDEPPTPADPSTPQGA